MNAEQAWQLAVDELEVDMPRMSFIARVRDTRLISYEMGRFRIEASDGYTRDWLAARLTSTVRRSLTGMMNRAVEVEFVVKGDEQRKESREQEKEIQKTLF
jgi:chromosomal replication initiation ATPase DnaA